MADTTKLQRSASSIQTASAAVLTPEVFQAIQTKMQPEENIMYRGITLMGNNRNNMFGAWTPSNRPSGYNSPTTLNNKLKTNKNFTGVYQMLTTEMPWSTINSAGFAKQLTPWAIFLSAIRLVGILNQDKVPGSSEYTAPRSEFISRRVLAYIMNNIACPFLKDSLIDSVWKYYFLGKGRPEYQNFLQTYNGKSISSLQTQPGGDWTPIRARKLVLMHASLKYSLRPDTSYSQTPENFFLIDDITDPKNHKILSWDFPVNQFDDLILSYYQDPPYYYLQSLISQFLSPIVEKLMFEWKVGDPITIETIRYNWVRAPSNVPYGANKPTPILFPYTQLDDANIGDVIIPIIGTNNYGENYYYNIKKTSNNTPYIKSSSDSSWVTQPLNISAYKSANFPGLAYYEWIIRDAGVDYYNFTGTKDVNPTRIKSISALAVVTNVPRADLVQDGRIEELLATGIELDIPNETTPIEQIPVTEEETPTEPTLPTPPYVPPTTPSGLTQPQQPTTPTVTEVFPPSDDQTGQQQDWLLERQQLLDTIEYLRNQILALQAELRECNAQDVVQNNKIAELQNDLDLKILQFNQCMNQLTQGDIYLTQEQSQQLMYPETTTPAVTDYNTETYPEGLMPISSMRNLTTLPGQQAKDDKSKMLLYLGIFAAGVAVDLLFFSKKKRKGKRR